MSNSFPPAMRKIFRTTVFSLVASLTACATVEVHPETGWGFNVPANVWTTAPDFCAYREVARFGFEAWTGAEADAILADYLRTVGADAAIDVHYDTRLVGVPTAQCRTTEPCNAIREAWTASFANSAVHVPPPSPFPYRFLSVSGLAVQWSTPACTGAAPPATPATAVPPSAPADP